VLMWFRNYGPTLSQRVVSLRLCSLFSSRRDELSDASSNALTRVSDLIHIAQRGASVN